MESQLPLIVTSSEMRDLQRDFGVGAFVRLVDDLVFVADHWWQYHDLDKEWIRIDDGETVALIESFQARLAGGLFPGGLPRRRLNGAAVSLERLND
jgi:hypothetical protein